MKRKLFTFLLAIVASVGTMFAASGTCGENLTWNLSNGTLTISGFGTMTDYLNNSSSRAPWYSSRSSIKSIVIEDGVTSIGDYAFYNCRSLTSVTIGNSVTSIGSSAFTRCSSLTSVVWNAKNCSNSGSFGSQVESFVFGNEVETIPALCCDGMNKLSSIEIPNSVTSIESSAFRGCSRCLW